MTLKGATRRGDNLRFRLSSMLQVPSVEDERSVCTLLVVGSSCMTSRVSDATPSSSGECPHKTGSSGCVVGPLESRWPRHFYHGPSGFNCPGFVRNRHVKAVLKGVLDLGMMEQFCER